MAASTMGTDSSFEQSLENGRTSALFPERPNTVACWPTTTMLAWESSCVVMPSPSLVPNSAVVAQTALMSPLRCWFGTAAAPPQVDGEYPWGVDAGSQPDFPRALVPIEANFSMRD